MTTESKVKTPDIEQTISAMNDSVSLINKIIEAGAKDEKITKILEANFKHLDLMVEKDFVKNSGKDLSSFATASAAAKAFIA